MERLVRYCAHLPFSQERLDSETVVHHLRKPLPDGRTELVLTPVELLARLAAVISPPHLHKHRNGGVPGSWRDAPLSK